MTTPHPPADGSLLTTALIVLFFVLGVPFGIWAMWASLTFDKERHPDIWSDK